MAPRSRSAGASGRIESAQSFRRLVNPGEPIPRETTAIHGIDAAGMRAQQRPNLRMEEENFGTVRAFEPQTGKWKWEYKMSDLTWAGRGKLTFARY